MKRYLLLLAFLALGAIGSACTWVSCRAKGAKPPIPALCGDLVAECNCDHGFGRCFWYWRCVEGGSSDD